jgi:hypothetical protein
MTWQARLVDGAAAAVGWWLSGDHVWWVFWAAFALAVVVIGARITFNVADALATLRLKRSGAGGAEAIARWLGARGPDGRTGRYTAYMASPQWAERSQRTIMLAGGTCQRCGRRTATQAHHLTYDRLTRERDADLLAVCKPCHDALHGR